eukprot:gene15187-20458_t
MLCANLNQRIFKRFSLERNIPLSLTSYVSSGQENSQEKFFNHQKGTNKRWVEETDNWMVSFAYNHFRNNGARKFYLKNSCDNDTEQIDLAKDLIGFDGKINSKSDNENHRKIRIFNIGNNHLIKKSLDSSHIYNDKIDHNNCYDADYLDIQQNSMNYFDFIAFYLSKLLINNNHNTIASTPSLNHNMYDNVKYDLKHSFDCVTMCNVLSSLPTPDNRENMIKVVRDFLVSPGFNNQPHHTGILLIVENETIFGNIGNSINNHNFNKTALMSNWKEIICRNGFELIRYRSLVSGLDGTKSHAWAFSATATTDSSSFTGMDSSKLSDKLLKKMFIKQDFDVSITSQLDNHSNDYVINNNYNNITNDANNNNINNSSYPQIRINHNRHSSDPVGIIGGGLGGCALALALQNHGIPFKMFEKDPSFSYRRQGYALTMQQGGSALRSLGLGSDLITEGIVSSAHHSYQSDGTLLGSYGRDKTNYQINNNNEEIINDYFLVNNNNNNDNNIKSTGIKTRKARFNIHIPRQRLRDLLLNSIDPQNIIWGKKLIDINNIKNDSSLPIQAHFHDNSKYNLSAIIGADGVYSMVRCIMNKKYYEINSDNKYENDNLKSSQLLSEKFGLNFLGLMVILGISPNLPNNNNENNKNNNGNYYCQRQWLNGETRLFSMPFDRNNAMWQLSFPMDEHMAIKISSAGTIIGNNSISNTLKQVALNQCKEWTNEVIHLISNTDLSLISGHPVYDREPYEQFRDFSNNDRATLLGDAAHPMSPFK